MADVLGTVLNAIAVVKAAVDVYQKYQGWPDQMRIIGRRMERLGTRLAAVEHFLRRQTIDGSRTDAILAIIDDVRTDSKRIEVLLTRWRDDVGPFDLQFRFHALTQAYFALGSSADELAALGDEIDKYSFELAGELQLLQAIGVGKLLAPGQQDPPPVRFRDNYNVIFIDPYNRARGMVAEGYMKLLRGWAVRAGGAWPVRLPHSAGFFVRNGGGLADAVEGMEYAHPSHKMGLADGGQLPDPVALAALFDNNLKYPFKQSVKQHMKGRRWRGMAKTMFKTYDFVVVFTNREYDNLVRLRKALIARDGKDAVTGGGKGRVVHLGAYLTLDGIPREILAAKGVGNSNREMWNVRCSQIKTAIKQFLTKEMGWQQPKPGA